MVLARTLQVWKRCSFSYRDAKTHTRLYLLPRPDGFPTPPYRDSRLMCGLRGVRRLHELREGSIGPPHGRPMYKGSQSICKDLREDGVNIEQKSR